MSEQRHWDKPESEPIHIFVDAAGLTSRCAAVMFCDDEVHYTDGVPNKVIMEKFNKRNDRQGH